MVVFDSQRSGSGEIWTALSDGSGARQLTQFGGALTGSPQWAPDGRSIVFDTRAKGQADVYTMDPRSGALTQPTAHDQADDIVPTWSRDGETLYFGSKQGRGFPSLASLEAAGRRRRADPSDGERRTQRR